ncbi:MAG: HAD family hydrolase [Clostridia bacterium]|nr:HAD family hydrolase [Clostridia bacterium]
MRLECVFWDWNGTLFDDAKASWLAVNDMLTVRNLPLITFEQYREYVDVPIIRFYEKVMDISKESMNELSEEFHSLCAKHLPENPLAGGAKDLLRYLHNEGIKQYIFSSSHNKKLMPYLTRLNIDKYFDAVLGADDCFAGSKIERTEGFIKRNGINPDNIVFIGDMVHDSDVAKQIGSKCILISNGHQSEKTLKATGIEVVATLDKLLNKFSQEVFLL